MLREGDGESEVGDEQKEKESLDDVASDNTSKSACGSNSSRAPSLMFGVDMLCYTDVVNSKREVEHRAGERRTGRVWVWGRMERETSAMVMDARWSDAGEMDERGVE